MWTLSVGAHYIEMKTVLIEKLLRQAAEAAEVGLVLEAVALYKRVLKHSQYHLAACGYLSGYYQGKSDYRQAAHYLRLLNEGNGPQPDLLLTIAKFYTFADDVPGAIAAYEDLRRAMRGDHSAKGKEYKKFADWQITMLKSQVRTPPIGISRSSTRQPTAIGRHKPKPAPERTGTCPKPRPEQPPKSMPGKEPRSGKAQEGLPQAMPVPVTDGQAGREQEEPIGVSVLLADSNWPASFVSQPDSPLSLYRLRFEFHRLTLLRGYDDLICLTHLSGVEQFWYQIETVKKVLRDFGGRVLLGDEVGLGKTIEACMAMKEFLLRGLVRSVLILTPASLVSQWKEELTSKFALSFITTDDVDPARRPDFWEGERIIASINVAKSGAYRDQLSRRSYDLVIVDEAHHLKNRETLNWKLVNNLKSKYLFMLSATPVQNNLIELFNLITLLKPGTLKTEALFKREYVKRGNPQEPVNPDRLRELLRSVMIRNTRSLVDLKLPKRFAMTLVVDPLPLERQIYDAISNLVREGGDGTDLPRNKTLFTTLLREAGSSPFALQGTLSEYTSHKVRAVLDLIHQARETGKGLRLLQLLQENPQEKTIIFSQFRKTLDYLAQLLDGQQIPYVTYHGSLPRAEKEHAIRRFREAAPVLLATESGGEGHNIQFARTLVNYDLPWNPMRIEQRIGRLHRVGQSRDVFIFNLCLRDTLEHYLLDVLEKKINMFELVIGEIDMILGNLDEEKEFSDIVFNLWKEAGDRADARTRFDKLGEQLVQAKARYQDSTRLDNILFHEEFEV